MKSLVFDAGPIISMTLNNLLWTLDPLKQSFGGDFYITENVKQELVDKPLETKKFKFEALQVLANINSGTLKILPATDIQKKTEEIMNIANSVFFGKRTPIRMFHYGEISSIAAARFLGTDYIAVDERTTRLMIEDADFLAGTMKKKFHFPISIDKEKMGLFLEETKNIKILRSAELVTIAYNLGILDNYVPRNGFEAPKKTLLESVLWGVKLNGCSLTEDEINDIVSRETK